MVEHNESEAVALQVQQPGSPPQESTTSWPATNRFRTIVRQNSERIGTMAEVILPMNKRSVKARKSEDMPDGVEFSIIQGQSGVMDEEKQVKVEVPTKKFPIFIAAISLIQIMFFVLGDEWTWLMFCYDPFRRHELWRFFSDMLVHRSLWHLMSNVIFQLILGLLLEIVHHWKRIGTIYMAGVLGGGLAVTLFDPLRYSLGASAGVYGLLLAHLATIILNWDQMDCKFCRLFSLLFYIIVIDIGSTLYVNLYLKIDSRVSHAGHVGGAIAGFIAAVFVLRNFEKLAWEKQFQKILAVISIVLFVIVVIVNVAFPSLYQRSVFNFHYVETFVYYVIKTVYGTPEWESIEPVCMEDPECAAFVKAELQNTTQTATTESQLMF